MDGSVFLWNLQNQTKELEFMQPRCNFSCIVASADVSRVFAVGTDQMLKEVELATGSVKNELSLSLPLGQLALSASHRLLFAGSSEPQQSPRDPVAEQRKRERRQKGQGKGKGKRQWGKRGKGKQWK